MLGIIYGTNHLNSQCLFITVNFTKTWIFLLKISAVLFCQIRIIGFIRENVSLGKCFIWQPVFINTNGCIRFCGYIHVFAVNQTVNECTIVISIVLSGNIRLNGCVRTSLFSYTKEWTLGSLICNGKQWEIGFCLIDNCCSCLTIIPAVNITLISLLSCLTIVEVNFSTGSFRNNHVTFFINIRCSHIWKNLKFNNRIIFVVGDFLHRYFYNQLVIFQYIVNTNIENWFSFVTGYFVIAHIFCTVLQSISCFYEFVFQLLKTRIGNRLIQIINWLILQVREKFFTFCQQLLVGRIIRLTKFLIVIINITSECWLLCRSWHLIQILLHSGLFDCDRTSVGFFKITYGITYFNFVIVYFLDFIKLIVPNTLRVVINLFLRIRTVGVSKVQSWA